MQNVMLVWDISTGQASNATVGPGSPQPSSFIKVKSILAPSKLCHGIRGVQVYNPRKVVWQSWRLAHIQILLYCGTISWFWYHWNTLYNLDIQVQKKWTILSTFLLFVWFHQIPLNIISCKPECRANIPVKWWWYYGLPRDCSRFLFWYCYSNRLFGLTNDLCVFI